MAGSCKQCQAQRVGAQKCLALVCLRCFTIFYVFFLVTFYVCLGAMFEFGAFHVQCHVGVYTSLYGFLIEEGSMLSKLVECSC